MKKQMLTGIALSLAFVLLQAPAAEAQKARANKESARAEVTTSIDDSSELAQSYKVRLSPIVLASSGIALDATTQIGDSPFAVGLAGEYMQRNSRGIDFGFTGVGLTSTYFFRGSPFENSWFVTPRAMYRMGKITIGPESVLSSSSTTSSASADFDLVSIEAMFGFQWHWTNFNFSLGAGPSYNMLTVKNVSGKLRNGFLGDSDFSSSGSSSIAFVGANIDLSLGWSF
jgi:hypothetical protein